MKRGAKECVNLLIKKHQEVNTLPDAIIPVTIMSDQTITSDANLFLIIVFQHCVRVERRHYLRHSSRCILKVTPDELERQLCYREQPLSMIL